MRRIDENTYIDDTLVTCAEYQLFIDEMREQGKYHHPDHWTFYQFQKGKAREPILGMRYSDAMAFCKWLSRREASDWRYRLPTTTETIQYSLKPNQSPLPFGYWRIMDTEDQSRFVWIGSIPNDARNVTYELEHAFHPNVHQAFDLNEALNRARNRPLDFDLNLPPKFADNRAIDIVQRFELDLDLARELANSLVNAHTTVFAIDIYIDIFTLQERIAGRSPAFEGIRLVKERIR